MKKRIHLKQSSKDYITIGLVLMIITFFGLSGMKYRADQINSQQKMTESVAMNQSKWMNLNNKNSLRL